MYRLVLDIIVLHTVPYSHRVNDSMYPLMRHNHKIGHLDFGIELLQPLGIPEFIYGYKTKRVYPRFHWDSLLGPRFYGPRYRAIFDATDHSVISDPYWPDIA